MSVPTAHVWHVTLDEPITSSVSLGGLAPPQMNVARLHPSNDQAAAFEERPDLRATGSWSVHGGDMFLMRKVQAGDTGPRDG